MKTAALGLLLALCFSACSPKTEDTATTTDSPREFSIAPSDVVSASVETLTANQGPFPPGGMTQLHIEFSGTKSKQFRQFTKDHVGQKVQILIGTNVISSPVIQSEIVSAKLDLPFLNPAEAHSVLKLLGKK